MSHRFEDDPAWVKFKCVELAKEIEKYGTVEKIMETADKIQSYILPKAHTLTITGGKDAAQTGK